MRACCVAIVPTVVTLKIADDLTGPLSDSKLKLCHYEVICMTLLSSAKRQRYGPCTRNSFLKLKITIKMLTGALTRPNETAFRT